MKELRQEMESAARNEYDRAAAKFGAANNSAHESYAIITEEYEEAGSEAEAFHWQLMRFWGDVKANRSTEELPEMMECAISAACEWVQVAAMCYKAMQGMKEK